MKSQGTYETDERTVLFEFETDPDFLVVTNIIEDSADAVISEGIEYAPYLLDYMIDYNLIRYLTKVELPKGMNGCHRFIYDSGIIDEITKGIPSLRTFIRENTEKLVNYRKKQAIKKSKIDDLLDALTHLAVTFQKQFEGVDINETIDALKRANFFQNMSEGDIVKKILELHAEDEKKADSPTPKGNGV